MKLKKVISVESKSSITGTYTNWVCTLECGHVVTRIKWKRGMRERTNPAPTKAKCWECDRKDGAK